MIEFSADDMAEVLPLTVKGEDSTTAIEPGDKSSTTVTSLTAPQNAYLYDYHQTGEGYKVIFEDSDSDMTMKNGDTKAFEVYVNNVKVGTVENSGKIIESLATANLENGKQYPIVVKEILTRTNENGNLETLESEFSTVSYINYNANEVLDNKIAKVFVNTVRTDGTKDWNLYTEGIKKDIASSLIVVSADGTQKWTGEGSIKLRGNSTAGGQKKPYNIKFNKGQKQDLFGFGEERKWSLLANTFDKSLIRNQVGMQFHANVVEPGSQDHNYTSKSEAVDLYIDGNYLGSYLLLESVESGKSRVDIDDENKENHEILLELDGTGRDRGGDAHLRKDDGQGDEGKLADKLEKSGYWFTINAPEGPGFDGNDEDTVKERTDFWNNYLDKSIFTYNYLTDVETEISKGADSDFNKIAEMIDIKSFVNFYITAELWKITDVGFSSVRFYIKNVDGKDVLYAGPLWDLDLSSGNNADPTETGLHAQTGNKWFGWLMQNPTFKEKVRERYEELLPEIKKLFADGGTIHHA